MVELKDRINKPRVLRGTPSYAFLNKLSLAGILISSAFGIVFCVAHYFKEIKREDYGQLTFEQIQHQHQEERVRLYVQKRREDLAFMHKVREENERGLKGS